MTADANPDFTTALAVVFGHSISFGVNKKIIPFFNSKARSLFEPPRLSVQEIRVTKTVQMGRNAW